MSHSRPYQQKKEQSKKSAECAPPAKQAKVPNLSKQN